MIHNLNFYVKCVCGLFVTEDWTKPHRDKWFEVEKVLELSNFDNHHIHLEKTDTPKPFEFTCDYKIITQE